MVWTTRHEEERIRRQIDQVQKVRTKQSRYRKKNKIVTILTKIDKILWKKEDEVIKSRRMNNNEEVHYIEDQEPAIYWWNFFQTCSSTTSQDLFSQRRYLPVKVAN